METIPLEMDDIFEDNDDPVTTRLPDLDDLDLEGNLQPMIESRFDDNEEAEGGEEPLTDNPELLAKLKSLKGASKNGQRRTHIKLDATRLTGERGIPILPKIFKNVKLKGKHHEAEDLKTIMHRLEHWGHRLFPKMPFVEVLERTERLGAKKAVQTCVKRIRLGMPILVDDYVEDEDVRREGDRDGSDENEEPIIRETTTATSDSLPTQAPNDDEIDEFLSTAAELESEQTLLQSQKEDQSQSSQRENASAGNASLSEEAKARIERNKKLAMERRAARLAKANMEEINNSKPPSPSLQTTSQPKEPLFEQVSRCTESNKLDNSMEMSNDEDVLPNGGTDVSKDVEKNLSEVNSKQMDNMCEKDEDRKCENIKNLKDNICNDTEIETMEN